MVYAGVEAYRVYGLWYHNQWRTGRCDGRDRRTGFVCLLFQGIWRDMTTSWSISPLWHLQFAEDNVKSLHQLSPCCRCRLCSIIFCLWLNSCWKLQLGNPISRISLTDVVSRLSPSRLSQFFKLHMVLPNTLHALLHHFEDCAHHPAGFIIFAQLAQLWMFLIILFVFPILLIVGICKISQTVSDSSQHLLTCLFRLSGCRSCLCSFSNIVLLQHDCCLWVFNSHSFQSSIPIHIFLDPYLFLFVVSKVCVSMFLYLKLLAWL